MPRTKKPKNSNTGCEQTVKEFNRLVQLRVHKLELEYKSLLQKFDTSCQTAINRFPLEIQNMTLRELLAQPVPQEPSPQRNENLPPKTPGTKRTSRQAGRTTAKKPKRTTAASDDGYQSESTASQASKTASIILSNHQSQQQPPSTGGKRHTRKSSQQTSRQRERSASRGRPSKLTSAAALASQQQQQNKQKNLLSTDTPMKTPSQRPQNSFVITPKVKLNSHVNVLRKPRDGEMVFSTQGSPLLVSTTVNERTANINVPLENGKVVSLLPFHETSLSENLPLDEETKNQLKILQSHLAKVLD